MKPRSIAEFVKFSSLDDSITAVLEGKSYELYISFLVIVLISRSMVLFLSYIYLFQFLAADIDIETLYAMTEQDFKILKINLSKVIILRIPKSVDYYKSEDDTQVPK